MEKNNNKIKVEKYFEELKFDDEQIKKELEKVNKNLKSYIEENILPEYNLNDKGHNIEHINYVLKRAFEISSKYSINNDILYTCICFHDIACHIDRDKHELLSAKRAEEDKFLNQYFDNKELEIIISAIEDHRASLEYIPRNIYGKILSSADRKVEIKVYLISSMSFNNKNNVRMSKNDCIENSYQFAIKKFGKNGYAVNKSYVNDLKYQKFLKDIQYLIEHKEKFYNLASMVYDELFKLN